MTGRAVLAALAMCAAIPMPARAAGPIAIVAAENFYGDVARQIGGPEVTVRSILNDPAQDPHLFEASPSAARAIASARIVIENGLGYDPWMASLLRVAPGAERKTIVVATLAGRKRGDNPHIWYDPAVMLALAGALCGELSGLDPAHRDEYRQRRRQFRQSLQPVRAKIAALRARLAGTPVAATEPIFGYMFASLGMTVRERRFQIAMMNNTEPSAADIARFENDLKAHRVELLVANRQVSNPIAEHMQTLARASHIPVVAITETEPADESYQQWMLRELDAVGRAVAKRS